MKGEIYKYEGKEYVLEGKYYDEYIKQTGVELNKEYSIEEADILINSNVISVYKGIFHCQETFIGHEICDLLSKVKEEFEIRCDIAFGDWMVRISRIL